MSVLYYICRANQLTTEQTSVVVVVVVVGGMNVDRHLTFRPGAHPICFVHTEQKGTQHFPKNNLIVLELAEARHVFTGAARRLRSPRRREGQPLVSCRGLLRGRARSTGFLYAKQMTASSSSSGVRGRRFIHYALNIYHMTAPSSAFEEKPILALITSCTAVDS